MKGAKKRSPRQNREYSRHSTSVTVALSPERFRTAHYVSDYSEDPQPRPVPRPTYAAATSSQAGFRPCLSVPEVSLMAPTISFATSRATAATIGNNLITAMPSVSKDFNQAGGSTSSGHFITAPHLLHYQNNDPNKSIVVFENTSADWIIKSTHLDDRLLTPTELFPSAKSNNMPMLPQRPPLPVLVPKRNKHIPTPSVPELSMIDVINSSSESRSRNAVVTASETKPCKVQQFEFQTTCVSENGNLLSGQRRSYEDKSTQVDETVLGIVSGGIQCVCGSMKELAVTNVNDVSDDPPITNDQIVEALQQIGRTMRFNDRHLFDKALSTTNSNNNENEANKENQNMVNIVSLAANSNCYGKGSDNQPVVDSIEVLKDIKKPQSKNFDQTSNVEIQRNCIVQPSLPELHITDRSLLVRELAAKYVPEWKQKYTPGLSGAAVAIGPGTLNRLPAISEQQSVSVGALASGNNNVFCESVPPPSKHQGIDDAVRDIIDPIDRIRNYNAYPFDPEIAMNLYNVPFALNTNELDLLKKYRQQQHRNKRDMTE